VAGLAKFNTVREKPLVLLSPLHWGLGHTTRCIPLIRELILLQCDVIVACTVSQRRLLELEFQSLIFFEAPATEPVYGKNRTRTIISLLLQIPKNLTMIKQENRWLQEFLSKNQVDAIISDNRFGFYTTGIPCIFITHQLQIKTGLGAAFNALARRINYRFINKFSACWVPDFEEPRSMAGELSNPAIQPKINIKRIGGLSRFEHCIDNNTNGLLIILSGPEPQRSLFEKKIIEGLKNYAGSATIVRGLPGQQPLPELPPGVQVYDHLPAATLNQLICGASMVIGRCGYTSVMDLVKLQKKSILVPTPGQAEQEYLAKYLRKKQLAFTLTQHNFSLGQALQQAEQFPYKKLEASMDEYKRHLQQLVQELRQRQ
jgi:UDP-N-acetylglucosamine transferase subunit ALG13